MDEDLIKYDQDSDEELADLEGENLESEEEESDDSDDSIDGFIVNDDEVMSDTDLDDNTK